jgi:hypothetical protein
MNECDLGRIAGIHARHVKALADVLVILASSRTPPLLHKGPTGYTFQRINSDMH